MKQGTTLILGDENRNRRFTTAVETDLLSRSSKDSLVD